MVKQFAVLGSPITHSKSPAIHLAAYRALGFNWGYDRFEVNEADFDTFVRNTRLDGASLTMPLKAIAFERFGSKNEVGRLARAVNTLVLEGDTFRGFNTDVFGLQKALEGSTFDSALVLGSGATARNALIAISLINAEAAVSIRARNATSLADLVTFGRQLGLQVSDAKDSRKNHDLVISTLPPKVAEPDWIAGQTQGTLLDVAYNPWPSELAKHWSSFGGNVVSGLEMLIWQAIAQIRIFKNGNDAVPLDDEHELASVMRNAATD